MPKSIPLRPTLRVHGIRIVIGDIRSDCLDIMLEYLAVKSRFFRYRERKAEQYTL